MSAQQMDSLADLMSRVQAGDPAAFDAVMERFQDLVYGLARTRVRRPEDAQDICQEVFLEAFQKLGALREPHYLPAWLGRLVVKHADRLQRRRSSPAMDPARADELAAAPAPAAGAPDEPLLAQLTAALARLPSGQRLVLVLHYLCRRSVAAIAETLDLTEAAVKKRLFDGRRRLEERMRTPPEQAHLPMPSEDAGLARAIRFFLAVRRGELEAVAALLREDPALVHAREQWAVDHGQRRRLPDASGQTALIRASQNGDQPMIDLLLAHGARVADACSCANGEQALHAAVLAGSLAAVERLLRSHADATSGGLRGFAPLHLAAMRERDAILARLLAHGAAVDARDGGGRTPLMWAAMHGSEPAARALLAAGADPRLTDHQGRSARDWAALRGQGRTVALLDGGAAQPPARGAVAPPLGGRRFDALGQALDGGASLEDAVLARGGARAAPRAPTWWTGIKAIDLFCPLPAGGRIEVHGGYGVGRLVVVSEIARRLALEEGVVAIWTGWERHHAEYSDLAAELAEVGIDGLACMLWHRQADPPAAASGLAEAATRACRALCARGHDVLLLVADHPGQRDQIDALRALASGPTAAPHGRLGVALLHDLMAPPPGGGLAEGSDACIAFDVSMRTIGCYPAIHPLLSLARGEASAIAERARAALARLRAHVGWPARLGDLPLAEARALRLQWFLSQPFDVTEFFMLTPGEHLARAQVEAAAAAILDGAYDAVPLETLRYRGEAPPPPSPPPGP